MLGRLIVFMRWLFSPERLPEPPGKPPGAASPSGGLWTWICAGESLPEKDVAEKSRVAPQTRFLDWLLSSEVCPRVKPPTPRQRVSFLRWLASGEEL